MYIETNYVEEIKYSSLPKSFGLGEAKSSFADILLSQGGKLDEFDFGRKNARAEREVSKSVSVGSKDANKYLMASSTKKALEQKNSNDVKSDVGTLDKTEGLEKNVIKKIEPKTATVKVKAKKLAFDNDENYTAEQYRDAEEKMIADLSVLLGVDVSQVSKMLRDVGICVFEIADVNVLEDFVSKVGKLENVDKSLKELGTKELGELQTKVGEIVSKYSDISASYIFEKEVSELGKPSFVYSDDKAEEKNVVFVSTNTNSPVVLKEENFAQNLGSVENLNENFGERVNNKLGSFEQFDNDNKNSESVKAILNIENVKSVSAELTFEMGEDEGKDEGGVLAESGDNILVDNEASVNVGGGFSLKEPEIEFREKVVVVNGQEVEVREVIESLTGKIKVETLQGKTEVKIMLKPEELGEVHVKLISENGIVTAEITAKNEKVREMLQNSLGDLKSSLEKSGVSVHSLEVNVSGGESEKGNFQSFGENQNREVFGYGKERVKEILSGIVDDEVLELNSNVGSGNDSLLTDDRVLDYIV